MHDGLQLANYCRVGRSLQAAKSYAAGDVVLQEIEPLLRWNGDSPTWDVDTVERLLQPRHAEERSQELTAPSAVLQVPIFFVAAAAAYCAPSSSASVRALILDMHVPDLPIRSTLMDLTLFCERVSTMVQDGDASEASQKQLSPSSVLHAILAAKVNAHRGDDVGEWRMYRTGSKLAHSCDPNCCYLPAEHKFVAIRPIQCNEMLSFSYLGGPPLLHPARLRQERLLASHLFLCQCDRCRGPDTARVLRCPFCQMQDLVRRTSPLIDSDEDVFPERLWHPLGGVGQTSIDLPPCLASCGAGLTDAQMLSRFGDKERILESRVLELTSRPTQLTATALVLAEIALHLGRRHWLYAAGAGQVAKYLHQLGTISRNDTLLSDAAEWHSVQLILVHMCVTGDRAASRDNSTLSNVKVDLLTTAALVALAEVALKAKPVVGSSNHLNVLTSYFGPHVGAELQQLCGVVCAMRSSGTSITSGSFSEVDEVRTRRLLNEERKASACVALCKAACEYAENNDAPFLLPLTESLSERLVRMERSLQALTQKLFGTP